MAFKDVDVEAIQGSLQEIKERLNTSKEKISVLPEGLNSTENWKCDTGEKMLQKLQKFPDRIQQIIGKIESCEAIVAKIGKYKDLESQRNEKAEELSSLQREYDSTSSTILDADGSSIPNRAKSSLGSRIDGVEEEISTLENEMNALEQEINGMGI